MDEDLPPEVRAMRQNLYPIIKEAKRHSMKAHFKADKLVVEGIVYNSSPESLNNLPDSLQEARYSCRSNENALVFFHHPCPLSNHHPARFVMPDDNVVYNCSEQYIKVQEALVFKDYIAAHDIMKMKNPVEMMKRARLITNYDRKVWEENIVKVCYPGILEKYKQNKKCAEFLRNTGQRRLGEASKNDKVWGIGMSMHEMHALNVEHWGEGNLLGRMLERVRLELFPPQPAVIPEEQPSEEQTSEKQIS